MKRENSVNTQLEVAVEHGFAAHVVFVGDLLGLAVVVLQVGAVDGSDQGFTQVQLVDLGPTNTTKVPSDSERRPV